MPASREGQIIISRTIQEIIQTQNIMIINKRTGLAGRYDVGGDGGQRR